MSRLDVYAVVITPAGPITLGPPELFYNIERAAMQLEAGVTGEFSQWRHPQLSRHQLFLVMATKGQTAAIEIYCHTSATRPSIRPPRVTVEPVGIVCPEPMTLYITGRVTHRRRATDGMQIFATPFIPERADIDDPDWFARAADYYADDGNEMRAGMLRDTARALEAMYSTSPGLIRYADRRRR